jgi:putative selenate reductase
VAELVPLPFELLVKRALLEYERERKIFDLPQEKFFRGDPALDTSVRFHGRRAATPVGPAAGPHDQLVQNIVLAWLAGARIIELKTVQILDELQIPRPCIDATNVGYNVEWSQELRLEASLREYVGAAMLIEILKSEHVLGDVPPAKLDTLYDMSVGYNLEGIRSERVTGWIRSMQNAAPIVNELRAHLTGPLAKYRDLPFPTRISDAITLSTFHGCPAEEIEGIVTFLLTDLNVDVCIKLNPTLLGRAEVDHLLHDRLGYREIRTRQEAFDKDLQLADALAMIPRLVNVARDHGRHLAVKCSNTLVVQNHRTFFTDEVMYLSGPPLHVITMNLVKRLRDALGASVPISFSAGLDAHNVANAVAMNLVPTTTCTDLLRPGGYARLPRYVANLEARMRELGAAAMPDFIMRHAGQAAAAVRAVVAALDAAIGAAAGELTSGYAERERRWLHEHCEPRLLGWVDAAAPAEPLAAVCAQLRDDFEREVAPFLPPAVAAPCRSRLDALEQTLVDAAGLLNTPVLVEQATADPRYGAAKNAAVPRKIGSKLWLYDCINCDKCVPVCPNDANFVYEGPSIEARYDDVEIGGRGETPALQDEGGVFRIATGHQLANYADACNDCGNCDVFCPEDGGPYVAKPRFFGSLDSYRRHAGKNGFYLEADGARRIIHGTVGGKAYRVELDPASGRARFDDGVAEAEIALETNRVLGARFKDQGGTGPHRIEMRPFLTLRYLAEAAADPRHVHFVNVAGL